MGRCRFLGSASRPKPGPLPTGRGSPSQPGYALDVVPRGGEQQRHAVTVSRKLVTDDDDDDESDEGDDEEEAS